jgi:hypothetical protein
MEPVVAFLERVHSISWPVKMLDKQLEQEADHLLDPERRLAVGVNRGLVSRSASSTRAIHQFGGLHEGRCRRARRPHRRGAQP